MLFNLGFHAKYIQSPLIMLFHPAKVLLKGFAILFKIISAHWSLGAIAYAKLKKSLKLSEVRIDDFK